MNDLNQKPEGNRQRLGGRAIPRWTWLVGVAALITLALLFLPSFGPKSLASLLPFVFLLACPLMMIFMMGSMNHMHGGHGSHDQATSKTADQNQLDIARLAPEDQVRALRSELTRMNWRQETLRQDLERLETEQREQSSDPTTVHP